MLNMSAYKLNNACLYMWSPLENTEHFLFCCTHFQNLIVTMMNEIEGVQSVNIYNLLCVFVWVLLKTRDFLWQFKFE